MKHLDINQIKDNARPVCIHNYQTLLKEIKELK